MLLWINLFIIFLPPTLLNGMPLKPVAWSGAHTDPILAMMCDKLTKCLDGKNRLNLMEAMEDVFIDPQGWCYCQLQLDKVGAISLTNSRWGEIRVVALVTALVHVLEKVVPLGVEKIGWLREDTRAVGCSLPFQKHIIYIKPSGVLHPLDGVGTTLHEMGHHMVHHYGHHYTKEGGWHCQAWQDATKFLTVTLRVSKI